MTEFSGIDPLALKGMISSFSTDKESLHGAYNSYFYRFGQHGLDTAALTSLNTIATWMDDQVPGLKRRYTLAVGLEHGGDLKTVVQVPEPVISSAAAQKQAQDLAKQLASVKELDGKGGDQYHQIALELAKHQDDPDYCSAFYAALKPPNLAVSMPSLLAATGSKTAPKDLEAFSKALGEATRAPYPAAGFDKVKALYTTAVPKGDYGAGWDRMAMMQYGDFDSTFAAAATRAAVLDQLAKDPNQDFRGTMTNAQQLGLPQDTVAMALGVLGNNGPAAFTAIAQMGDPKNPDLQGHLDALFKYAKWDSDVQTNLGKAVDAGAGVTGHTDAQGNWHADPEKHDDYQSTFAYCAMLAAGNNADEVDKYFDGWAKQDMGRLAASYPAEMTAGGNDLNQNVTESMLGVPADYTNIPGVNPAFTLSSADTYKFLKTFAGDDSYTAPYDEVMGNFQHDILVKCAQEDAKAVQAGKADPQHYDIASLAFGNTGRLQYDAEMKVRGDMDASDEANREGLKRLIILGSEVAGEPEMGYGATLAWRVFSFSAKEYGGAAYVDHGEERTEGVNDKNYEMLMQTRYNMTSTLLEGGWQQSTPLPDDLKGPDGKLKPFEELAKDNDLDSFNDWVNEQRTVPGHDGDPSSPTGSLQQKQAIAGGLMDTSQADGVAHEVDGG
ncbi:hypothetical protein SAMN05216223_10547 [Actinacidiphila yanglinensis]|uniref:Uncharacterized protein n=1 Tax=Actinacidiphila yanglinensis TaxID=310779 RepID=A0A1H5ZZ80_9ACTN|nr:hypothetical protein [Actinacidiphila yanglinensis]SEG41422.1 hypothetical protein SAMN05216223_10547 [Actinacidiphila yanglinensis]